MTNFQANPVFVSADKLIRDGEGFLFGIIVNSHSSGVISLFDNTETGQLDRDNILTSFTIPAGAQFYMFAVPVKFVNGLFFELVSGTANITLLTD